MIDVRAEAEARADAVMAQLAADEQEFELKQQVLLAEIVRRAVPDLPQRGLDGAWFNHVKLKAAARQLTEVDLAQLDSLLALVAPAAPVPGPRR